MKAILGITEKALDGDSAGSTDKWLVFDDSQAIPYVGFGGIIKAKQGGVVKWIALVLTKVQFSNPGVTATTQGETIEWQTKSLSATVMRDDSTAHVWQMQSTLWQPRRRLRRLSKGAWYQRQIRRAEP